MWPIRRTRRWNPWCKRSASLLWAASQTLFQQHWLKRQRVGRRIIWTMATCPWCILWTLFFALQGALSTSLSPETPGPRARSGSPVKIVVKRLATPRCNDVALPYFLGLEGWCLMFFPKLGSLLKHAEHIYFCTDSGNHFWFPAFGFDLSSINPNWDYRNWIGC